MEYYTCTKVTRNLPRDMPCTNLYKIVVCEDIYQEIQEHFIDITNDPNVDGIYELQVCQFFTFSIHYRAELEHILGSTCPTRSPPTRKIMCSRRYDTNSNQSTASWIQLDRFTTFSSWQRYLGGGKSGKYIFLYPACAANGTLHVFALFLPSGRAKLFLVDPANRRQAIPRLPELCQTMLQKKHHKLGADTSVAFPPLVEFSHTYHSNDITAILRRFHANLGC